MAKPATGQKTGAEARSGAESMSGGFNLLRRLALTSLLAVIVAATGLVALYWFDQLAEHRIDAERLNEKIAKQLAKQHQAVLVQHIADMSALPAKDMRQPATAAELDGIIEPLLEPSVVKVKLYSRSGLTVHSSVHGEIGDIEADNADLGSALKGETSHVMEFRSTVRTPGGELQDRHLVRTYRPLFEAAQIVGVFEVYSDITATIERTKARTRMIALGVSAAFALLYLVLFVNARRADDSLKAWQAERAVEETQLRIAATSFQTQQPMVITDAKGCIVRVNRAFLESTGYTEAETVGQTPRILKSGRHDGQFYRDMWAQLAATGSWQGEIWDRRKNGEVYPKWLSISTVYDGTGAATHYVGVHFDLSERKRAEEQVRLLAYFDPLTGLPNRTLLHDRLTQATEASQRDGRCGAVAFIDLDNFKALNDTQGHDCGDLLLRQVAQRLTACVRKEDTVARLGGDEFVVMLSSLSTSFDEAARMAKLVGDKILESLNSPYMLKDVPYRSTPSIGVTLFKGTSASNDELLKQADLAMYKSKETGRNTMHFFDPAMEDAVRQRAALESAIAEAIEADQFVLYYQIQFEGDRAKGAEVLVRWRHPSRGMVSPVDFIPLAEETGLILPLGTWVMETACRQLAAWARQPGMEDLILAVNVSARQLRQPDFVQRVRAAIRSSGANPRRLKIELTESMLVNDVTETISKMLELQAEGISFALDDFGTGYSSLSYLKRLPLSQLKIDQSFITEIPNDANSAVIATAIIRLGQSLGLEVIAEGVENEAQRDFLQRNGCLLFQGYYFGRPQPADIFESSIRKLVTMAP